MSNFPNIQFINFDTRHQPDTRISKTKKQINTEMLKKLKLISLIKGDSKNIQNVGIPLQQKRQIFQTKSCLKNYQQQFALPEVYSKLRFVTKSEISSERTNAHRKRLKQSRSQRNNTEAVDSPRIESIGKLIIFKRKPSVSLTPAFKKSIKNSAMKMTNEEQDIFQKKEQNRMDFKTMEAKQISQQIQLTSISNMSVKKKLKHFKQVNLRQFSQSIRGWTRYHDGVPKIEKQEQKSLL